MLSIVENSLVVSWNMCGLCSMAYVVYLKLRLLCQFLNHKYPIASNNHEHYSYESYQFIKCIDKEQYYCNLYSFCANISTYKRLDKIQQAKAMSYVDFIVKKKKNHLLKG